MSSNQQGAGFTRLKAAIKEIMCNNMYARSSRATKKNNIELLLTVSHAFHLFTRLQVNGHSHGQGNG